MGEIQEQGFMQSFRGQKQQPKLCTIIVVPCYNEEKRLNQEVFLDFAAKHPNIGFVFVDDGSQDNTLALLVMMRVRCPQQVEVIKLSQNSGKAEAVRAGLVYATALEACHVGYWDADLATPLEAVLDFHGIMQRYENIELVYGARRNLMGHRIHRTFVRRMISKICALLARFAISMPVSDTQCGAKLFKNSADLRASIAHPFSVGWLFDVELFARLAQNLPHPKKAFYEYPLSEWMEVAGSKITSKAVIAAGFSVLGLIARVRIFKKDIQIITPQTQLSATAMQARKAKIAVTPALQSSSFASSKLTSDFEQNIIRKAA